MDLCIQTVFPNVIIACCEEIYGRCCGHKSKNDHFHPYFAFIAFKKKVVPFLLSRIKKLDRRLRAVSLLLVRVFEQRSLASCEGLCCEDANTRALATRATLLLKYSRLQVFEQKRDYLQSNSTAILTPEKPRDIAFMLSVLSACKDSGHRE